MDVIIGLEIHEQLLTKRKLFCNCATNYRDAPPNANVCPICSAQPGAKPMGINLHALESVIKIACALDCEVITDREIYMQRKHYFYPDLPNNYQRTSTPVAINGNLNGVGISEVHFEEDPGRYNLRTGEVDLNRCGIPLIEIVTEPDIRSPDEARNFLKELHNILDFLEVARLEEGTMRVDANISLEGGSRVEVKNINSFKGVYKALNYEIMRQKNLLKRGKTVLMETRHFDENQMITTSLRRKETVEDYRYIPDPDIPPIIIQRSFVEKIKKELPELPKMMKERFVEQYSIPERDAKVLTSEKPMARLFEQVASKFNPHMAAYWIKDELRKELNYKGLSFYDINFEASDILELLRLIDSNIITREMGKEVLKKMVEERKKAREIIEEMELKKIDTESISEIINKVIEENTKAVKDYIEGREEALNFLVGQVMKYTRGRADPREVFKVLKKELSQI